jgi:hypothetical protein
MKVFLPLQLVSSVLLCINRRIAVRQRLQRMSQSHKVIDRGDVPDVRPLPLFALLRCFLTLPMQAVHEYIMQEYARMSLLAYESLPRDTVREGWGRPSTTYFHACHISTHKARINFTCRHTV